MSETLFFLAVGLIVYTYFVYPTIILVAARLLRRETLKDSSYAPPVSLIVAAHNEADVIEEKVRNCLALDYPADRLEIIIASDGSTDGTNEIVQRFAADGVRLNILPRGGKMRALNQTVPTASHGVLVFSDANAMYRPGAIRELVGRLADPFVGAVSGDVRMVNKNQAFSASEGLYYRYERALQLGESAVASMVGVDGAMYAMRKELYQAPSDDIICDDFVISMNVIRAGYRVVYHPDAIAEEDAVPTLAQELRRRSRYIAATIHALLKGEGLPRWSQLMHWWMYLSHKLLRWLVPVFMLVALLANIAAPETPFWRTILGLQVAFYALAALGALWPGAAGGALIRVPFYFCLQNLGALQGLVRGVMKLQKAAWASPSRALVVDSAAKAASEDRGMPGDRT